MRRITREQAWQEISGKLRSMRKFCDTEGFGTIRAKHLALDVIDKWLDVEVFQKGAERSSNPDYHGPRRRPPISIGYTVRTGRDETGASRFWIEDLGEDLHSPREAIARTVRELAEFLQAGSEVPGRLVQLALRAAPDREDFDIEALAGQAIDWSQCRTAPLQRALAVLEPEERRDLVEACTPRDTPSWILRHAADPDWVCIGAGDGIHAPAQHDLPDEAIVHAKGIDHFKVAGLREKDVFWCREDLVGSHALLCTFRVLGDLEMRVADLRPWLLACETDHIHAVLSGDEDAARQCLVGLAREGDPGAAELIDHIAQRQKVAGDSPRAFMEVHSMHEIEEWVWENRIDMAEPGPIPGA